MLHGTGLQITESNGITVIENEFIRWEHDPAAGGELSGAYVKYGTGKNLLMQPQSSALCPWIRGGWRQYHHFETALGKADTFSVKQNKDGTVTVSYTSKFYDKEKLSQFFLSHVILTNQ